MTDFIIVTAGADSLDMQNVEIYLESDALEYRQVFVRVGIDVNLDTYIVAEFDALWAEGVSIDVSLWDSAKDKNDIRRKAAQAIIAINNEIGAIDLDIAVLDDAPTNGEVLQVVRNNTVHLQSCLGYIRKIARYLGDS